MSGGGCGAKVVREAEERGDSDIGTLPFVEENSLPRGYSFVAEISTLHLTSAINTAGITGHC